MNDELKNAASPYAKLEKTIAEQNTKLDEHHEELKAHTVMLDRLCTLKENQNISDINFRNSWQHGKRKDLLISLVVIGLASTALYLDVIKVDPAILGSMLRVLGLVL